MKLTMEGFTSVDFDKILTARTCTYKTNRTKGYKERITWQNETHGWANNHWEKITEEEIERYNKSRQLIPA